MDKMEWLIIAIGLTGIFLSVVFNQLALVGLIAFIPFTILGLNQLLRKPILGLYFIFTLNYFIMLVFRYTSGSGFSVFMDIFFVLIFVVICINHVYKQDIPWNQLINGMAIGTFCWMAFCILEIINPYGVFSAWISMRMLIVHTFICVFLTSVLCKEFRIVKTLVFLLSIFTLAAIVKVIYQKYVGFDSYEIRWLNEGGARTHIIRSGIRYFSFFTDASNFGSNMGFTGAVFLIVACYIKKKSIQIYYFIVSVLSIYAMFLSGTRGAIVVPLGALALFCITSKNAKAMVVTGSLLVFVYLFFAFTTIGEGNAQIRRMRTAFNPTKDASFIVRQENRAKLLEYMKNKPLGVGLGMAGGNAQKYSSAYTTTIPTDSWFVMIWVQTGVVGLTLYIMILLYGVIHGAYIIMYKIRDKELKGFLTALVCGVFGFLGSAYTTDSFGQFPCHIMTFMFLTICLKGELYQKEIDFQQSDKISYNYELQ